MKKLFTEKIFLDFVGDFFFAGKYFCSQKNFQKIFGGFFMENIKKIFSKIKTKKHFCIDGEKFLDPIRNIFVPIMPEEIVRQKMLIFLMQNMSVPRENILVEEHLAHWTENFNGRMDIALTYEEKIFAVIECKEENIFIESMQFFEQAKNYAENVGAKYIILVNGNYIQFYHLQKNFYKPVEGILNFSDMLEENFDYEEEKIIFERLNYEDYFDLDFLNEQDWYYSKIGEDTPENLIPCIINFDDCLWDETKKLKAINSKKFFLIDDFGIRYRKYNDNSDGGFGSGYYRIFHVKNCEKNFEFLIGFLILTTGKTFNDPKYGNQTGKSVLCVMYYDGKIDETSVQINLNKFLAVDEKNKKAVFTHNGASRRKGFRKADFIKFVQNKNKNLVRGEKFYFGEIDYSVPLTLENPDVVNLISNLIEYSVYRSEYKNSLL